MNDDQDPYKPPQSDLRQPPALPEKLELLPTPRSLPLKAGISWLSESWPSVKKNLAAWIFIILVFFIVQVVLGSVLSDAVTGSFLLPVILLLSIISELLSAGVLAGARASVHGQPLVPGNLIELPKRKIIPLSILGTISFAVSQAAEYVIRSMLGINLNDLSTETSTPQAIFSNIAPEHIIVLVILYLIIIMMFWFTTPLVALNDTPPLKALSLSFQGCLRNPLPLIVYCLAMVVLIFLGALPLLLGLLVVLPWMFSSMYVSYRQIFLQ